MKIIFKTDTGFATVIPSGELPIEEVARKDVPAGVKFKYVETVPETHDFADFDGLGADYGVGTNLAVVAYDENGCACHARSELTGEVVAL